MKKTLLNTLLLGSSLFVCVLLAEITLPLLGLSSRLDYFAPQFPITHPIHGYLSRPKSEGWYERADFTQWVQFNELGHHDYPLPKDPPSKRRIITAGGSFTAGLEVDISETWPKQLAELLGQEYQVINMAAQARKFSFFARYFDEQFFKELQPDLLLFGFSYGRLSADARYEGEEPACLRASAYRGMVYFYGSDGESKVRAAIDRVMELDFFPIRLYESESLLRRSSLVQLALQYQLQRSRELPELAGVKFQGNIARDRSCNKEYSDSFTRANINSILSRASNHGVPVLFFFIPKKTCYLEQRDAASLIPKYFRENETAIDLCQDFKAEYEESGTQLHWQHDDHPNQAGTTLIAKAVLRKLQELNYLRPN